MGRWASLAFFAFRRLSIAASGKKEAKKSKLQKGSHIRSPRIGGRYQNPCGIGATKSLRAGPAGLAWRTTPCPYWGSPPIRIAAVFEFITGERANVAKHDPPG